MRRMGSSTRTSIIEVATAGQPMVAGPNALHLHFGDSLYGYAVHGKLDRAAVRWLIQIGDHQLDSDIAPHPNYGDYSAVSGIELGLMGEVAERLRQRQRLARFITQQAIVVPTGFGLPGAFESMFRLAARLPLNLGVFSERVAAFEWLGCSQQQAEWHAQWVAKQLREQQGEHALTSSLRTLLEGPDRPVRLADVARRMHMSARTLQRRLDQEGTSFRRELLHARVEAAKELLRGTNDKISTIADIVGFCSTSHFSEAFRRLTSLSPAAWRRSER